MNTFISLMERKIKLIIYAGFVIGLFTILIGSFTAEAQQSTDDVVSQKMLDEVRKTKQRVNKPVKIQLADVSDKEMTIEVQSRVIALPGGESGKNIAKVPIKSARFRSTELRDLNTLYNAVSIERIYEVAGVSNVSGRGPSEQLKTKARKKKKLEGKRILRKKGGKYFESNSLSADGSGKISADKRVKIRKKKKSKAKKRQKIKTSKLGESQDTIDEESIGVVNDMFIISFKDYKDANGQTVNVDLDAAARAYEALPVVISAVKN